MIKQLEQAYFMSFSGFDANAPDETITPKGALCQDCNQYMLVAPGCTQYTITIRGTVYSRIRYGGETRAPFGRDRQTGRVLEGKRCHDCGALTGHYHHRMCDVEECPRCGYQLISCDCFSAE